LVGEEEEGKKEGEGGQRDVLASLLSQADFLFPKRTL